MGRCRRRGQNALRHRCLPVFASTFRIPFLVLAIALPPTRRLTVSLVLRLHAAPCVGTVVPLLPSSSLLLPRCLDLRGRISRALPSDGRRTNWAEQRTFGPPLRTPIAPSTLLSCRHPVLLQTYGCLLWECRCTVVCLHHADGLATLPECPMPVLKKVLSIPRDLVLDHLNLQCQTGSLGELVAGMMVSTKENCSKIKAAGEDNTSPTTVCCDPFRKLQFASLSLFSIGSPFRRRFMCSIREFLS